MYKLDLGSLILQPKLNISQITSKDLRTGKYQTELPELYDLKGVVENSLWHDHQNVFDHIVLVYENLEKEWQYQGYESEAKLGIEKYFKKTIGDITRKNVLKIATLLHDIGKKDAVIIMPDGQIICPGHEHIAVGIVKDYQNIFGLSSTTVKYIERIVLHHGFISEILNQVISKPKKKDHYWTLFENTVGDIAYDLLFLMKADLNGCDLRKAAPSEFQIRNRILEDWIKSKIPT